MTQTSQRTRFATLSGLVAIVLLATLAGAQDVKLPRAFVDGTGPGWRALGEDDFVMVNGDPDTWSFKDGVIHCKGLPIGVTRSKQVVTNFELVVEWMHEKPAGNSG